MEADNLCDEIVYQVAHIADPFLDVNRFLSVEKGKQKCNFVGQKS